MKDIGQKLLVWVAIVGIVLTVVFECVTVVTNLSIKTMEHEKVQWELDTAKKDNELVKEQIKNERIRYKVFETLTGGEQ